MRSPYDFVIQLVESGSISKASAQEGISQPALSKRLQRLEDELGIPLFRRTPSGLAPTVYGRSFVRHMRILQAELENARMEIAELKGAAIGHVRMGASPTVAASILPGATFELYAKGKGIHVTVVEAAPYALVRLVSNAEIEFAICTEPHAADTAGLTVETLFQDKYVLVASGDHPLCGAARPTLADVQAFPWILTGKSLVREWLNSRFVDAGLRAPVPQIETDSLSHIREVIRAGTFVGFLSKPFVQPMVDSGELGEILADEFYFTRSVAVVYRETHELGPASRRFIESVTRAAANCGCTVKDRIPPPGPGKETGLDPAPR